MSNNHEPRRRFLRQVLAIVPAASVASGAALTQAACSPSSGKADTPARVDYHPVYLQTAEWRFLLSAVDRLIPEDEYGPGALKAGVPEFIDRQMETPYGYGKLWYMQGPFHSDLPPELGYQLNLAPRDIYRLGIKACDDWCAQQYQGKSFSQLGVAEQEAILMKMEQGQIEFDAVPSNVFFSYLLKNTKEGFFSDPIYGGNKDMAGWKMIGFPGARAAFGDWIDRPNVKFPYGPVSIDGRRA
ncbi:gluconate 2-dehydrogenase subunit 3 family protein [Caballeronia glebae]|uniref:Gluconate 2-dehydrogenase (Acceptor) n=1 Tax=Caballeronia glebae TaxID=1777143 RepID=A0A158DJ61_9BURK|nr:gluconate 2-dehydrogenase subunit 3 family protein [Caballeronia glebae]SAK94692.1 gluconate 2-dehydrogenase (acceptor) [Caballeronia glebae]